LFTPQVIWSAEAEISPAMPGRPHGDRRIDRRRHRGQMIEAEMSPRLAAAR